MQVSFCVYVFSWTMYLMLVDVLLLHGCVCTCVLLYVFACLSACSSTGQFVWGLDHSVLLLPSGCMPDGQRDEVADEDTDVSCVHCPRMLLKKLWTVNEACPFTVHQRVARASSKNQSYKGWSYFLMPLRVPWTINQAHPTTLKEDWKAGT